MADYLEYILLVEFVKEPEVLNSVKQLRESLASSGYFLKKEKKIDEVGYYGFELSFEGKVPLLVRLLSSGIQIEVNNNFLNEKNINKNGESIYLDIFRLVVSSFYSNVNAALIISKGDLHEYYSIMNFSLFDEPLIGKKKNILYHPFWAIYLGPSLVKLIGKKEIENAPALKKEKIKEGAVLINGSFPIIGDNQNSSNSSVVVRDYFKKNKSD